MEIFTAFVFYSVVVSQICINNLEASMYEINLDSWQPDPNSDRSFIDFGTLRMTKKSRNLFVISGTFELFQNTDDNTKLMHETYFNKNSIPMFIGEEGFCQGLNTTLKIARRVLDQSSLPPPGTCPIPKGKYTVYNYELDEDQFPFVVPKGEYTTIIKMVQENQYKAGYKQKVTVK